MNKIEKLEKEIEKLQKELLKYNKYNSVFMIKTDATIKDCNNIKKDIYSFNIDVEKWENLGVKKLAYSIKKFDESLYISFDFVGTSEDIQKLESFYRENNNILKFIVVKDCEY